MSNSDGNEQNIELNFESCVLKLARKAYATFKIDSSANAVISNYLILLFKSYVKNIKESVDGLPTVEDIQKVTEELFPPILRKHAISEAHKEVFTQSFSTNFVPERKNTSSEIKLKHIEAEKKKDRDLLYKNLSSGLKTVLNETLPGCKLDKTGNKGVTEYLLNLTEDITLRLKQNKPKKATTGDVQKVIENLFPIHLAEHAKSEAHRMLFEFKNDLFEFSPENHILLMSSEPTSSSSDDSVKQAQQRSEDTRKNKNGGEKDFKKGLMALTKEIHTDLSLNPPGQKIICEILNELRFSFVDNLKQAEKPRTLEQMQNAIQRFIPPLMAEHATAEGQKMVLRFESGELDLNFDTFQMKNNKVNKDEINKNVIKLLKSGVTSLAYESESNISLNKSALSNITETLKDFLYVLIKSVHDIATHDITISNIRNAAKEIVPKSLVEHGIAEGEKMIRLYESKKIQFVPKTKKQTQK